SWASQSAPLMGPSISQGSWRVWVSSAIWAKYRTLIAVPLTAFTSGFMFEPHIFDDDALVGRLAHVVDGERRYAAGGHGFHFDPGFVIGAAGGLHRDGVVLVFGEELDAGKTKRQAVAQGDKLGTAFGRQHTCHAGGVKD